MVKTQWQGHGSSKFHNDDNDDGIALIHTVPDSIPRPNTRVQLGIK